MYDISSIKLLKKTIFILSIWFLGITYVYSWGSLKTGEAFATHQYINEQAYRQLEQHPAFFYVGFPTLEDIQNYASVRLNPKFGKYGLGPDVDGNSNFSEHWYNPKNKQGNAPTSAKKYHALLKDAMEIPRGTEYEKLSRKEKAKAAAYASHYIQDVTCPMHVTGMSGKNVDPDRVGGKKDISPFAGKYTPEQWKILVKRFQKAQKEADSKLETRGTMDYFDPLYFDANYNNYQLLKSDIGASELGSHFQFELQVELKYKADIASWDSKWKEVKEKGYIHPYYSNTKSIDTLAKKVASNTYDAIGTENSHGELWVDIGKENSAYEIPQFLQMGYLWFPKESNRDSIYNSIQVPYKSWWKAIQLTYVVWRSTFSAMHIAQNNIKFVKVPNKHDQYQLYVAVFNYEPESEAKGVEVEVGITGDIKLYLTTTKVSRPIPAGSGVGSGWLKVGNPLTITNPNTLNGKIELSITGDYDENIPDSGKNVVEYDLKDISIEALRMPDMIGSSKDDAKLILEEAPYNFNLKIKSAGASSSIKQSDNVKTQDPEAGEIVASGENVILEIYDKFQAENSNLCKEKFASKIQNIKKEISAIKNFSNNSVANCKTTKETLDQLAKKIEIEKNSFAEFTSKINDLMKKMKDTEKVKEALEKHDQKIDKLAKEIENILSELGEFSLKICQKTKSLNDHSISSAEHSKTAQWIQDNKKELKIYVESIKERHKEIDSYKKEIKKFVYDEALLDTQEVDNLKTKLNSMDNLSKEIIAATAQAKKILVDSIKSNSGLYARKQAIRKSIDNLKNECGDKLSNEIKMLNEQFNTIDFSQCTKDLGSKIKNLKNSALLIQNNITKLNEQMNENQNLFTEYTQNVEKIKSLNKNREITLLLVNNYVLKAKRFGTDGAICVVLSEETMKKVFNQIVYRIEGAGYTPHWGGGSYYKEGYAEVLVTFKEPATEANIRRIITKIKDRYITNPCDLKATPLDPGHKTSPAIWKSGPKITIIKGPTSGLSSEVNKNGWKIKSSDGPSLSKLRKESGCKK